MLIAQLHSICVCPMSTSAMRCTFFLLFLLPDNSDGLPISPWQDIPLFANPERNVLNMVVEIPRWTTAKMEVSYTGEVVDYSAIDNKQRRPSLSLCNHHCLHVNVGSGKKLGMRHDGEN